LAKNWVVDKVANLERGGRLERVKPTFSPAILCRAIISQLRLAAHEAQERKVTSPGGKGEIPKEAKPTRVAVSCSASVAQR